MGFSALYHHCPLSVLPASLSPLNSRLPSPTLCNTPPYALCAGLRAVPASGMTSRRCFPVAPLPMTLAAAPLPGWTEFTIVALLAWCGGVPCGGGRLLLFLLRCGGKLLLLLSHALLTGGRLPEKTGRSLYRWILPARHCGVCFAAQQPAGKLAPAPLRVVSSRRRRRADRPPPRKALEEDLYLCPLPTLPTSLLALLFLLPPFYLPAFPCISTYAVACATTPATTVCLASFMPLPPPVHYCLLSFFCLGGGRVGWRRTCSDLGYWACACKCLPAFCSSSCVSHFSAMRAVYSALSLPSPTALCRATRRAATLAWRAYLSGLGLLHADWARFLARTGRTRRAEDLHGKLDTGRRRHQHSSLFRRLRHRYARHRGGKASFLFPCHSMAALPPAACGAGGRCQQTHCCFSCLRTVPWKRRYRLLRGHFLSAGRGVAVGTGAADIISTMLPSAMLLYRRCLLLVSRFAARFTTTVRLPGCCRAEGRRTCCIFTLLYAGKTGELHFARLYYTSEHYRRRMKGLRRLPYLPCLPCL